MTKLFSFTFAVIDLEGEEMFCDWSEWELWLRVQTHDTEDVQKDPIKSTVAMIESVSEEWSVIAEWKQANPRVSKL